MDILEIKALAEKGNSLIEESILNLLKLYPDGLSNSEIASNLNLRSSHEGSQTNYLTYSVLGNLMSKNMISKRKYGAKNVKFFLK